MHWQDIVIAIGSWGAIAALVPSLMSNDKPAVSSSLFTGTIITSFAVSYASLHFWSAAVAAGLLALTWYMLAYQQWRRKRKGMVK